MKKQSVILVTGVSSGFGKITANMLVGEGHIVYGTSRKAAADTKEGVRMLQMDVTNSDSIRQAIDRIIEEQGRIDTLVNNAGVGISGAIELATDDEIEWQMSTNFMGVVKVCKAVLPFMRKARKGKIINISSIAGVVAVPFQGFYSASKYAIEGYSEALASEVHTLGIRVCIVEPGDFQTNFTANRSVSSVTSTHEDYGKAFTRTMKIIENAENNGSNPKRLGHVISKLVGAKNPPFRTKVGPAEQVLFAYARGILPARLVLFIIRFFYRL